MVFGCFLVPATLALVDLPDFAGLPLPGLPAFAFVLAAFDLGLVAHTLALGFALGLGLAELAFALVALGLALAAVGLGLAATAGLLAAYWALASWASFCHGAFSASLKRFQAAAPADHHRPHEQYLHACDGCNTDLNGTLDNNNSAAVSQSPASSSCAIAQINGKVSFHFSLF